MRTYFQGIIMATVFFSYSSKLHGQSEWVRYTDIVSSDFEVESPGELSVKSKVVKTNLGDLPTLAYTFEGTDEDKNKLYLINKVEYPIGIFNADSIDLINEFLESSINTTAESIGGEVVYLNLESSIDKVSYLFRLKYNNGSGVVKGKAIIFENTFYMLQVYCHKDDSLNEEMNYFLNSFVFLPKD